MIVNNIDSNKELIVIKIRTVFGLFFFLYFQNNDKNTALFNGV